MLRLPKFRYLQPKSLVEAVRMMSDEGPDTMFVAGGTDLYPNMKRRQQVPKVVIGLAQLKQLRTIKGKPAEGMVLGAGLTLTEVAEDRRIQRAYPAVSKAAELISTPLLRNMGSIGGNLLLDTRCNYYDQNYEWRKGINFCMKKDGEICWVAPSSPRCWAVQSSDSAPVMVAIGAKVKLISSSEERLLPAAELYNDDGIRSPQQTARRTADRDPPAADERMASDVLEASPPRLVRFPGPRRGYLPAPGGRWDGGGRQNRFGRRWLLSH